MSNFNFSVLIPVYNGDRAEFFLKALESIYDNQTLKPNQIVIVVDGIISKSLEDVISLWLHKYSDMTSIVRMPKNVGLGVALSEGLKECCYDIVARMDSDDIARADRFEKQIEKFKHNKNLKVCGSNVYEFLENPDDISSIKRVPKNMDKIVNFAKYRNPVNHPTVMFNREAIQSIGGYIAMNGFEDYYLWVRCIMAGYTFHNIQESLVSMRGGQPQLVRRSGIDYFKDEINFFYAIQVAGFISFPRFILTIFLRSGIRLLPKITIKKIYQFLRKK